MSRLWILALLALGATLAQAGTTRADRTLSTRVPSGRCPGVRGDITVPYTTNGFSTLGVAQGVGPLIVADPALIDPSTPNRVQPVYNLIYYGSAKDFSSTSFGASTRPPNSLRPR